MELIDRGQGCQVCRRSTSANLGNEIYDAERESQNKQAFSAVRIQLTLGRADSLMQYQVEDKMAWQ